MPKLMTAPEDHNDDIALAGEYALHLMDAATRRAFEARLNAEPDLRRIVVEWHEQLTPLADGFTPVTPPPAMKARIETILFPQSSKPRYSAWRMLAGSLLAAVLAIGVLVLLPQDQAEPVFTPSQTASIAAEDGSLLVLASFVAETGTLRIDRQTGAADTGRVLELWLIADGADAPVSLGVLPDDPATDITLSAEIAPLIAGGTLAISDEPPGGSTTGAPTGAVLAVGVVTAI
jgi:anti-sigma-K factor RskA